MADSSSSGGLLGQMLLKLKADTKDFEKDTERAKEKIDDLTKSTEDLSKGLKDSEKGFNSLSILLKGLAGAIAGIPIVLLMQRFGLLKKSADAVSKIFRTLNQLLAAQLAGRFDFLSKAVKATFGFFTLLGRGLTDFVNKVPGVRAALSSTVTVLNKFGVALTASFTTLGKYVKTILPIRKAVESTGGAFRKFGTLLASSGFVRHLQNIGVITGKLVHTFEATQIGAAALNSTFAKIAIAVPLIHFAIAGLTKVLKTLGIEAEGVSRIFSLLSAAFLALVTGINIAVFTAGRLTTAIGDRLIGATLEWISVAAEAEKLQFGLAAALENFSRLTGDASLKMGEFTQRIYELSKVTGINVFAMKSGIIQMLDLANVTGLVGEQIDQLVVRMADFAAVTGEEFTNVIFALDQALRGFPRILQSMGLRVDKEEARQTKFARSLGKTWEQMTQLEKATALTATVMEQTLSFAGKAAEASVTTMSGAIARARGEFLLLKQELGEGALIVFGPFFNALTQVSELLRTFPGGMEKVLGAFLAVTGVVAKAVGTLLQFASAIAVTIIAMQALSVITVNYGAQITTLTHRLLGWNTQITGATSLMFATFKEGSKFASKFLIGLTKQLLAFLKIFRSASFLIPSLFAGLALYTAKTHGWLDNIATGWRGIILEIKKATTATRDLSREGQRLKGAMPGERQYELFEDGITKTRSWLDLWQRFKSAIDLVSNAFDMAYHAFNAMSLKILYNTKKLQLEWHQWLLEMNKNPIVRKLFGFGSKTHQESILEERRQEVKRLREEVSSLAASMTLEVGDMMTSIGRGMSHFNRLIGKATEGFKEWQVAWANTTDPVQQAELLSQLVNRIKEEEEVREGATDREIGEVKAKDARILRLQLDNQQISIEKFREFHRDKIIALQRAGRIEDEQHTRHMDELVAVEKRAFDKMAKQRRAAISGGDLQTVSGAKEKLELENSLLAETVEQEEALREEREQRLEVDRVVFELQTKLRVKREEVVEADKQTLLGQIDAAEVSESTAKKQIMLKTVLLNAEKDLQEAVRLGDEGAREVAKIVIGNLKEELAVYGQLGRNKRELHELEQRQAKENANLLVARKEGDVSEIARLEARVYNYGQQQEKLQKLIDLQEEYESIQDKLASAESVRAEVMEDYGKRLQDNLDRQAEIRQNIADANRKVYDNEDSRERARIEAIENVSDRLKEQLAFVKRSLSEQTKGTRAYYELKKKEADLIEDIGELDRKNLKYRAELERDHTTVIQQELHSRWDEALKYARNTEDAVTINELFKRRMWYETTLFILSQEEERLRALQQFDAAAAVAARRRELERVESGTLKDDEAEAARKLETQQAYYASVMHHERELASQMKSLKHEGHSEEARANLEYIDNLLAGGERAIEAEEIRMRRQLEIWQEYYDSKAEMEDEWNAIFQSSDAEIIEGHINNWMAALESEQHAKKVAAESNLEILRMYEEAWIESHQSMLYRGTMLLMSAVEAVGVALESTIFALVDSATTTKDILNDLGTMLKRIFARWLAELLMVHLRTLILGKIAAMASMAMAVKLAAAWAPAATAASIATFGGAAGAGLAAMLQALATAVAAYSAAAGGVTAASGGLGGSTTVGGASAFQSGSTIAMGEGGVVEKETVVTVAEKGEPEVIVPLGRLKPLLELFKAGAGQTSTPEQVSAVEGLFGLEGRQPTMPEAIERLREGGGLGEYSDDEIADRLRSLGFGFGFGGDMLVSSVLRRLEGGGGMGDYSEAFQLERLANLLTPSYGEGGVVRSEQIVRVAEKGEPEAIIPISRLSPVVDLLTAQAGMEVHGKNTDSMSERIVKMFGLGGRTSSMERVLESASYTNLTTSEILSSITRASAGGIFSKEQDVLVAEGGEPEVIIPIVKLNPIVNLLVARSDAVSEYGSMSEKTNKLFGLGGRTPYIDRVIKDISSQHIGEFKVSNYKRKSPFERPEGDYSETGRYAHAEKATQDFQRRYHCKICGEEHFGTQDRRVRNKLRMQEWRSGLWSKFLVQMYNRRPPEPATISSTIYEAAAPPPPATYSDPPHSQQELPGRYEDRVLSEREARRGSQTEPPERARPRGYKQGGVVEKEEIVRVAEDGMPEAIIPLSSMSKNVIELFGLGGKTSGLEKLAAQKPLELQPVQQPISPLAAAVQESQREGKISKFNEDESKEGVTLNWNQYGAINSASDERSLMRKVRRTIEETVK